MSTMTAEKVETVHACFGTYPHTKALKSGEIKSDRVQRDLKPDDEADDDKDSD